MEKEQLFEITEYFNNNINKVMYSVLYKGAYIDDGYKTGNVIKTYGGEESDLIDYFDLKLKDFPDNFALCVMGQPVVMEFTWDEIKKEKNKISFGFGIWNEGFKDSVFGYNKFVEIIEFELFKFPCFTFDIGTESTLYYTSDDKKQLTVQEYYEKAIKELFLFYKHIVQVISQNVLEELEKGK